MTETQKPFQPRLTEKDQKRLKELYEHYGLKFTDNYSGEPVEIFNSLYNDYKDMKILIQQMGEALKQAKDALTYSSHCATLEVDNALKLAEGYLK